MRSLVGLIMTLPTRLSDLYRVFEVEFHALRPVVFEVHRVTGK